MKKREIMLIEKNKGEEEYPEETVQIIYSISQTFPTPKITLYSHDQLLSQDEGA